MPTKEEILEFLSTLKPKLNEVGINKIGLFGSYAKGVADTASDIDITIESSQAFVDKMGGMGGFIFLEDLRKHIMKRFKISVDLCDSINMKEDKKKMLLKGVIYV